MDFIDGLPKSFGKTVIFVVVDRLGKAAHFMALSHPYTSASVAQAFLARDSLTFTWLPSVYSK